MGRAYFAAILLGEWPVLVKLNYHAMNGVIGTIHEQDKTMLMRISHRTFPISDCTAGICDFPSLFHVLWKLHDCQHLHDCWQLHTSHRYTGWQAKTLDDHSSESTSMLFCSFTHKHPCFLNARLRWHNLWHHWQIFLTNFQCLFNRPIFLVIFPSVLWHCWLSDRKGIRPVKTTWCWW